MLRKRDAWLKLAVLVFDSLLYGVLDCNLGRVLAFVLFTWVPGSVWVVVLVRSRIFHLGALRWIESFVCWKQHAKYDEVVASVVEVEGRHLKDKSIHCSLCRCHTDSKTSIDLEVNTREAGSLGHFIFVSWKGEEPPITWRFKTMGDRGGIPGRGCKLHPRQQGEGVCAQCLRTSLEKLAEYQGKYQEESLDSYTGVFSTTSVADFSRRRDANAQSYQPTYPNVSYRTRSKKDKPKGGFAVQDGSASNAGKTKGASSSRVKLTWGGAVHRITSLRTAFVSLWKSDRQLEVKRKLDEKRVSDEYHGKAHGQNAAEDGKKDKSYEQQHALHGGTGRTNGESKRSSISSGKTTPAAGPSSSVSKFTHRASNADDSQTRWRRSKSSREANRDLHVLNPPNRGPRTPDGNQAYDALSPILPVPHTSIKSSPWRFFSRSGSRRSPHMGFKMDTPKATPKSSTASDRRQALGMSNPLSRVFSPKLEAPVSTSKSALSSPSMALPDPHFQTTIGSKSTSWSRSLSPSSSKPSPLYLGPRTLGRVKGDRLSRVLIDVQEFLDQSKSVDVHGQREARYSLDSGLDSVSPRSFLECSDMKSFPEGAGCCEEKGRQVDDHVSDAQSGLATSHA